MKVFAPVWSELGREFGFAAHDGMDMRLENSYDAVSTGTGTVFKHLQLLIIHLDDGYY